MAGPWKPLHLTVSICQHGVKRTLNSRFRIPYFVKISQTGMKTPLGMVCIFNPNQDLLA